MNYVVIMAGGTGKRLWPLSREARPKQVLKIIEGKTLLRKCFERLTPIFDVANIIVQCNQGFVDLVLDNLPELPKENVIAEPAVRDTAGAIGLAATVLSKVDPDATMAVVTADHVISPIESFAQSINDGLNFINANPDKLLTFGIKPTFASTQYGYLKLAEPHSYDYCSERVFKVEAFREKPDAEKAFEYLISGQYCWNSGMFVWKAKTILEKLCNYLPDAREPFEKIMSAWSTSSQNEELMHWFLKVPKISIDYAVMEKDPDVHSIKMYCNWLDMGSFAALADVVNSDEHNNIVVAHSSELVDCRDSIFVTEDSGHMIAAIGLDRFIVAHSPDATLVCPIDSADRLKELLDKIKIHKGEKYL